MITNNQTKMVTTRGKKFFDRESTKAELKS